MAYLMLWAEELNNYLLLSDYLWPNARDNPVY